MKKFFSSVLVFSFLNGCSYYRPIAVSTTSLGPEHEMPIALVSGRSSNTYVFGIHTTGPVEGMHEALENAKQKVGADNLVNVSVDQKVTYFPFTILPLIMTVETIVFGTAVKYKDKSLTEIPDKTSNR